MDTLSITYQKNYQNVSFGVACHTYRDKVTIWLLNCHTPYPEPVYTGWSSVHWNATGMPFVDPVYTGIPLGDAASTCRIHWNTTGKKVETAPHRNATGETLTIAAYTGKPLGLQQSIHIQAHIVKQNSIHASLKWQDGGTTISKWTALCKFSFYFEFTALQWIPVLFFKRVSTSTLLCACLRCEQHYSFCIFGDAV